VAFSVALPIADRRVAHDFYRDGLGLALADGPIADDGLPEPLIFTLGDDGVLVLVPHDGFGFVSADQEVAERGHSECILGVTAGTPAEVDALSDRARAAGGVVKVEPGDPGWGYRSTVSDPDGHLWILQVR
jgi:predicted lactoylglutathione lyase